MCSCHIFDITLHSIISSCILNTLMFNLQCKKYGLLEKLSIHLLGTKSVKYPAQEVKVFVGVPAKTL